MSFRIALTTIAGALANRDAIEAYQRDFFRTARADGASADTRAYVFTTAGDTARLNRFLEFLLRHEIVTHRLARAVTVGERTYEPGRAFIVPTDQDQYRLIELMFERLTEFEENIYYDVSAWNVPLAFDLDYDALAAGRGAAAFNPGLLGAALEAAPTPAHAPPSPDGAYGYVFPWSEYYAPRALYRLLSEGVRVRIATKPATAPTADGGAPLVRGSVFVPLARQDVERARIEAIVADIAQEDGVAVLAATSGYTPEEGVDLGGPSFHPLDEAPSVLLLFDDGLSHYQAGEVWHLLDVGMHMPVTLRPKRDLGRLDLARYTHLVLVGGDDPSLEDEMTEALLDWVRRGGTLIATNEAAAWVQTALADRAEDEAGAADDEGAARDAEADAETDAPVRYDWADFERRETEHEINGALFAADLDTSHPLGFGYADRFLPTFRTGTHVLAHPQDNPFATPAAYLDADDLLLSGYASPERLEQAAGAPLAIAEREGAGAVVLIADSPDFRGAFPAMNKLFMNAIFFSSLIEEPDGEYDFD